MRRPALALGVALLLAPSLSSSQTEERLALVIGNGNYEVSPLRNPPNDARAMAAALRECGFEVIERIDSDQRTMDEAIREFGRRLSHGGVGVFYYAGHGMQVDGRNFLIPVGADIKAEDEVKYRAVDAGMVLGKMETAASRVNIVILDACRDNPFARSFRTTTRGLKRMDAPIGSFIAYATEPGGVAADGEGQYGLYTSKLLEHIRTPGLPVELVFRRVRKSVTAATGDAQVPWDASSLRDDFFFVAGDSPSVTPPQARPEPVPEPAVARADQPLTVQLVREHYTRPTRIGYDTCAVSPDRAMCRRKGTGNIDQFDFTSDTNDPRLIEKGLDHQIIGRHCAGMACRRLFTGPGNSRLDTHESTTLFCQATGVPKKFLRFYYRLHVDHHNRGAFRAVVFIQHLDDILHADLDGIPHIDDIAE